MKALLMLPLLAAMSGPAPEYPVHFHMIHMHYSGHDSFAVHDGGGLVHGEGIANISEPGQPTRGFVFSFDSCFRSTGKFPGELPARWTGPDHLQLVIARPDVSPTEQCTLNGRVKDFEFTHVNGKLTTKPLESPSAPTTP